MVVFLNARWAQLSLHATNLHSWMLAAIALGVGLALITGQWLLIGVGIAVAAILLPSWQRSNRQLITLLTVSPNVGEKPKGKPEPLGELM